MAGHPYSVARRRLLVTLGFGALNAVALSRLPGRRPPHAVPTGSAAGADTFLPPGTPDLATPVLEGAAAEPAAGHVYATAITGGRVIDPESGFDDVASVGIDGDRVTAVTRQPITGIREIDASGLVVAPGFVDLLSYEPNGYGEWFKVADGVTTNLGMHGLDFDATEYLRRWTDEGTPLHFGGAYDVPHRRFTVLGLEPGDEASPAQLDELADDARAQLAAGWIGVDLEPEYTFGSTYEELRRMAEVAAEAGVATYVHGRYSDDMAPGTNADTLAEILQLARDTGSAVHVQHLVSTGGTFTMEASLATLEAAAAEDIDVTACTYPYDHWATFLASARFAEGWQERFHITYRDLEVAGTGERLTQSTFADRQADNVLVAAHAIPEADVVACLRSPLVMIGSDGILEPSNNNHPRATGCFTRVLGRYVRDEGVLDLPTALAKMTIQPARRLAAAPAMASKGRLQRGADADIVVFDAEQVADRSTVADPGRYSTGMRWVFVAGTPVLADGQIDREARPGRAITLADSF